MKLLIDNIDSITGWSGSGGAGVQQLNQIPDFIAGNNSSSVMFKFDGINGYIEKSYNVDVSDYNELVFWIFSIRKGKDTYRYPSDFLYKIDFGTGEEFYLHTYEKFYWTKINVADFTSKTITKLKITSLHSDEDYVILSYFIASKDVFPLDIFQGIKEQIEYQRDTFHSLKNIGQITGSTGDTSITFSSQVDFLDRYTIIKIDDGVNSELHSISEKEGTTFHFGLMYDGNSLLNDFTDADVYVYYPVEFGTTQKEIILPGITIWGFAPEKQTLTNEEDRFIEQVSVSEEFIERQKGHYLNWILLIDCECKEEWELMGELSEIVRKFLTKKLVWVNGRKCNIDYSGPSVELYPTEAYDIIPKVQYPAQLSVIEEVYEANTLLKTTTIGVGVNISDQGEIP